MSALCLTSTLRQDASGRNSKTRRGCAETVEAGTFLWKGMEKPGEISSGESRNEGHSQCQRRRRHLTLRRGYFLWGGRGTLPAMIAHLRGTLLAKHPNQ